MFAKTTLALIVVLGVVAICVASPSISRKENGGEFAARPTRPPRPTRTPRTTRPPRTTTPTTTVRPPPDVIQTEGCGGVLEGGSGQIQYTIGGGLHYNNGIICVWTIRSPGTGRLFVTLDSDNFPSDDNAYISLLNVGNQAVEGQVAYVVFRSTLGGSETGFSLYFRGDSNSVDETLWTGGNKSHVHFHHNRAQGVAEEFSYPNPRARYQPNEFGSWVLNPEQPKMLNRLSLYYIDFEDFSCYDYINIHQVDGDSVRLLEKKCNTNTYFSGSFKYDTVREPFIVTLHTNWYSERTGFILYYSNDRDRWGR
ncbi:Drosocin [Folsomia candida]|uniref:Drosocin n=1 Tax=Folsomia candida TaxID=158441 RepID=A0A226DZZ3_FOLCA|nr:Drosocin [Folsomia candida]